MTTTAHVQQNKKQLQSPRPVLTDIDRCYARENVAQKREGGRGGPMATDPRVTKAKQTTYQILFHYVAQQQIFTHGGGEKSGVLGHNDSLKHSHNTQNTDTNHSQTAILIHNTISPQLFSLVQTHTYAQSFLVVVSVSPVTIQWSQRTRTCVGLDPQRYYIRGHTEKTKRFRPREAPLCLTRTEVCGGVVEVTNGRLRLSVLLLLL